MDPQPFNIDTEAGAETYLVDLLKKPKNRSMTEIARHCALRVRNPKIKAFFLTEGAKMLAEMKA
ncbi:hypothetical protein GOFOIKOB_2939 [Methylobacterium tardum]|jgi:hypothetical protein|uniref:Uncharacterized protein n=1 Tax=Methylobacterium tardum TaxID=374432 RepID=A0AA37TFT4_9HYPH|nr:hypothetical protein [Methylobacterium tardum]URD38292.1 hypothetical protein M6G65_07535 [Methylobacterium tardum]GJE49899.1 hypothetical protein GOFOIKOB_2939 [Methylobacterium tardum]GLS70103.1 hypothetical protein GCM10007890_21160 [Methylobacterium tardum]